MTKRNPNHSCIDCGKEYYVRPSQKRVRCNSCNLEKLKKDSIIDLVCCNCGKHFSRKKRDIYSENAYCSRSCAAVVNNRRFPKKKASQEVSSRKESIPCELCGESFLRFKGSKHQAHRKCVQDLSDEERVFRKKEQSRVNNFSQYGYKWGDYDRLLKEQNECCAICKEHWTLNPTGRDLCVDHCHSENKIRGLLCSRCNPALGKLLDTESFLENALEYLKKHKNNTSGEDQTILITQSNLYKN